MARKVALITGASSGIGAATAGKLARAGYRVMAAGRNRKRTERVVETCPGACAWIGDVTSSTACDALVQSCIDEFGRLDLLVNNAGIHVAANVEETADDVWLQTMAVNLNAAFYLCRAAVPHLRRSRGVILNIASDWGLVGGRNAVAYCASKGGMVLMTKAMAIDHASEGIRINAICPGDVDTPMLYAEGAACGLSKEDALHQAAAASPTGRVTTPKEVAALVLFLASDEAAQITGVALPVDGGNTAG